jgi:hypothetical protein
VGAIARTEPGRSVRVCGAQESDQRDEHRRLHEGVHVRQVDTAQRPRATASQHKHNSLCTAPHLTRLSGAGRYIGDSRSSTRTRRMAPAASCAQHTVARSFNRPAAAMTVASAQPPPWQAVILGAGRGAHTRRKPLDSQRGGTSQCTTRHANLAAGGPLSAQAAPTNACTAPTSSWRRNHVTQCVACSTPSTKFDPVDARAHPEVPRWRARRVGLPRAPP